MMVTFISQCEKKAINRTRRILDAFANRIGERTWQTIIIEEGLRTVKKLLRQTATKNTAVACHWIRSRIRSELVWVVGNHRKFNAQGVVPVNSTQKNNQYNDWENDWPYLPIIKGLVAIAALLHDWGKASVLFQNKLNKKKPTKNGDPIRHEWISCLLLHALVQQSGGTGQDESWLKILINGHLDEKKLVDKVSDNSQRPLENLPPLAQFVAWLIVTHHRLPCLSEDKRKDFYEQEMKTVQNMLKQITVEWGYQNKKDDDEYQKRVIDCFRFKNGLLSNSDEWRKSIKKWASRLLDMQLQLEELIKNGAWRVALHHARLCLMLGDHYYSSCEADSAWESNILLYANTQVKDKEMKVKQKLDEHLVRVCEQALKITQRLSRFTVNMDVAEDVKSLKQKSPAGYEWQDVAVDKIKIFKSKNEARLNKGAGWFIVNMASTGCGKTIANAKVMQALSDDGKSLRYILALGLRTLTLQTGDEYRSRIGLESDKLAVLIGSSAIQELHNQKTISNEGIEITNENLGSESMEQLLEEYLDYKELPDTDFLDVIISKHNASQTDKNKAFLYKPVLACTIDHIIAATETTRGGKYILPCLRLLSSDLVIDEVDDFDGKDLIAIGRLIHLAGMLGRKVMISSATIPPALAEGFFNAYQEGWNLHASFKNVSTQTACVWVDEFITQVHLIDKMSSFKVCQQYANFHEQFTSKRVEKLKQQVIKRKAHIVRCEDIYAGVETSSVDDKSREQQYFERIKKTAIDLHRQHHYLSEDTRKKISFGVVRMANISPCIRLSKYLMSTEWPENIKYKVMAYHSHQVLLLRHDQEKHLDNVLKRKEEKNKAPQALYNPIIKKHIDNTTAENILFILVATPVEEVGRDHDFDWAVIEPSSYRSIIQLAGRVRRHRQTGIVQPNIAIMQYNLKALNKINVAYCHPGYETKKSYKLKTHDLCELVDESVLKHAIDAIPRISLPKILQPEKCLADLEHKVISDSLTNYTEKGPQCLQAWLTEYWWLTALPQHCNRFRESSPDDVLLYLRWSEGKAIFHERNQQGKFVDTEKNHGIQKENIEKNICEHLWLNRDYVASLQQQYQSEVRDSLYAEFVEPEDEVMRKKSERYGELVLPTRNNQKFVYSDQFGLNDFSED